MTDDTQPTATVEGAGASTTDAAPSAETDIINHIESFGEFIEADLIKIEAWLKDKLAQV